MNQSVAHPRHRTRRPGRSPLLSMAVPIAVALAVASVVGGCGSAAADPVFTPGSCVHAYHDPAKNKDTAVPVGCGDPSANYRVLEYQDNPVGVCLGTPGVTATYTFSSRGPYDSIDRGYTLCLGDL